MPIYRFYVYPNLFGRLLCKKQRNITNQQHQRRTRDVYSIGLPKEHALILVLIIFMHQYQNNW